MSEQDRDLVRRLRALLERTPDGVYCAPPLRRADLARIVELLEGCHETSDTRPAGTDATV